MRTGRTPLQKRALAGMIAVIHQTGATVTVDGVDTPAHADRWREAGADTALGAYFPFDAAHLG
jgi:EAL domain-containing protein (putative c-di-GMP-specific phosphodiesterase class I)